MQGRTEIKNRPVQFPDDLPPYRPSPSKIVKNSEITFFPRKNDCLLLNPTGPPCIAQMQAWPVRPWINGLEPFKMNSVHSFIWKIYIAPFSGQGF